MLTIKLQEATIKADELLTILVEAEAIARSEALSDADKEINLSLLQQCMTVLTERLALIGAATDSIKWNTNLGVAYAAIKQALDNSVNS